MFHAIHPTYGVLVVWRPTATIRRAVFGVFLQRLFRAKFCGKLLMRLRCRAPGTVLRSGLGGSRNQPPEEERDSPDRCAWSQNAADTSACWTPIKQPGCDDGIGRRPGDADGRSWFGDAALRKLRPLVVVRASLTLEAMGGWATKEADCGTASWCHSSFDPDGGLPRVFDTMSHRPWMSSSENMTRSASCSSHGRRLS